MVQGKSLNGLAIKSWGDVVAFATLVAMFLSVVAWGLKLEGELNSMRIAHDSIIHSIRDDVADVQARVADGILPRAEERITRHDRELQDIRRRIDRVEEKL